MWVGNEKNSLLCKHGRSCPTLDSCPYAHPYDPSRSAVPSPSTSKSSSRSDSGSTSPSFHPLENEADMHPSMHPVMHSSIRRHPSSHLPQPYIPHQYYVNANHNHSHMPQYSSGNVYIPSNPYNSNNTNNIPTHTYNPNNNNRKVYSNTPKRIQQQHKYHGSPAKMNYKQPAEV